MVAIHWSRCTVRKTIWQRLLTYFEDVQRVGRVASYLPNVSTEPDKGIILLRARSTNQGGTATRNRPVPLEIIILLAIRANCIVHGSTLSRFSFARVSEEIGFEEYEKEERCTKLRSFLSLKSRLKSISGPPANFSNEDSSYVWQILGSMRPLEQIASPSSSKAGTKVS